MRRPQEYRKPRADVYTVLLVIALLVMLIATAALWMTMKDDYNNKIKGGPNPVMASAGERERSLDAPQWNCLIEVELRRRVNRERDSKPRDLTYHD